MYAILKSHLTHVLPLPLVRHFHTTPQRKWEGFLQHRLINWPRTYKPQLRDRKPIKDYNFMKGIVLKVFIKHPKKPNSGNRQCCLVRLIDGTECIAAIPGIGHNLQEHSQVHLMGARKRDLIGVNAKVVRGALDCAPVKKKIN